MMDKTPLQEDTALPLDQPDQKYRRLRDILSSYQRVLVAYSGGVDSTFLLRVALDCLGPDKVLACLGANESLAQSEYRSACELARQMGAEIEVVHPCEIANPQYQENSPDRCFHCRSELYRILTEIAAERHFDAVLCGSNADDLRDFRPGRRAALQFNVLSPLEEAGLTKADIRALSQQLHLTTWNKPAQPCLASRMAYGVQITPERLRQIEQGEEFLHRLGLCELRVRHHGSLVRIEVPVDKIAELARGERRAQIVTFFKKLGFAYVSLDLQGFRSGSANEVL